jgi:glycosyltransferase involved in cell wall biosynthesis
VRIALLTETPAPFRIPLFNALAAEPGVEALVLFLAAEDPRRDYPLYEREFAFARRFLPGRDLLGRGRWLVLNRGAVRELRRFRPGAIVIGGWNQPAFWQALAYGRLAGRPVVVWVESTARDERPHSVLPELSKRALVWAAAGYLVPGRAAADYVASLGAPRERIAIAPNAVDPEIFGGRVDEARRDRASVRAALGLDGCVFLCVSRLSPEKGVDTLARAFAGVPAELLVVGDGPQASDVRACAPPNVRFLGRLERDELPRVYAAADAFVVPSRSDTWGMVLNEAAAAGLPLIATEAPGAAYDLIEEGVNGFRVPVDDEQGLRAALARVAGDAAFRTSAGARSRELARGYTPEAWAAAVARLARDLVG